jgi:hypothetical protein
MEPESAFAGDRRAPYVLPRWAIQGREKHNGERFGGYPEEHHPHVTVIPKTEMATSGDYIVEAVWAGVVGRMRLYIAFRLGNLEDGETESGYENPSGFRQPGV